MKRLFYLLICCSIAGCTIPEDDLNDEIVYPEILDFAELITQEEYKFLTTTAQIYKAIGEIEEGGKIQFPAEEYTLASDLKIEKAVTLEGVGVMPSPTGDETSLVDVAGAGEISTIFNLESNVSIKIYANNVTFRHLKINDYALNYTNNIVEFLSSDTGYKCTRGFLCENVHFYGGAYHLSPRNYDIQALTCRYTTFEKWRNRAFFVNRVNEDQTFTTVEKCTFYRCEFEVWSAATKDARAISLDAGNNEDPNILDFDGMEMDECYFLNCGFASSKCQNFNITNCEFSLDENLVYYPIHLEEYSRKANITGNTFYCYGLKYTTMGIMDDCLVEGNKVIGECYGFMQGRYADEVVIRNNDLSELVNINTSNKRAISMWDSVGSKSISVSDNTFNSGAEIYLYRTTGYEDTFSITGNSGSPTENFKSGEYNWPLAEGAKFRIKHVADEMYLQAVGSDADCTITATADDDGTVWVAKNKVWPNRYNVYNEKYDTYLYIYEDTDGYSNADSAEAAANVPETKQYSSGMRLPIWDFTEQTKAEDSNGHNIVGPGGGNTGCVSIKDGELILLMESTRNSFNITNTQCLWEFEIVD